MSYSPINAVATGSPQTINIPWDYIERSHVIVRAAGVPLVQDVDYTWASPGTISITWTAGVDLEVTRSSSLNTRLADYVDGTALPEAQLDVDSKQPLYLLQEIEQNTVQLETRIVAIEQGTAPIPGATGVLVKDEGIALSGTGVTTLNFKGPAVVATQVGAEATVEVTTPPTSVGPVGVLTTDYEKTWDDNTTSNQTNYSFFGIVESIAGGRWSFRPNGNSVAMSRLDDSPVAQDFECSCIVRYAAAEFAGGGIAYRNTAYAAVNFPYAYGAYVSPGGAFLTRGGNGTSFDLPIVIGSDPTIGTEAGRDYEIRVVVRGTRHRMYVDGVLVVDAVDATYTAAGQFGVFSLRPESLATFDKVTVTSVAFPSSTLFTSSTAGVVPASGGGTVNFLRADGAWAEPPGGGGGGIPDYSAMILALEPHRYYPMDEPSGTAMVDASPASVNGTYYNSPTLNQASLRKDGLRASVGFNGTNNYAEFPFSSVAAGADHVFYLTAIIRPTTSPSTGTFLCVVDGTKILGVGIGAANHTVSGSNMIMINALITALAGSTTFWQAGVNYHLMLAYHPTDGELLCFANGMFAGRLTISGSPSNPNTRLVTIGGDPSTGGPGIGRYGAFRCQDVALWSFPVTSAGNQAMLNERASRFAAIAYDLFKRAMRNTV